MNKDFDETNLEQTYYLVQKNIGSNWVDRGRFSSEQEALTEVNKLVQDDLANNQKFIFRVIKIEEIKLFKSREIKPDNMLDVF